MKQAVTHELKKLFQEVGKDDLHGINVILVVALLAQVST